MPIIPIFLRMAVSYAMFKWMDSEKYAVDLIQDNPLDQNDLRAWMRTFGLWSFFRDVNLEQLANELNACIPPLYQAEEQQLPDEVLKQAAHLTDNGIVHDPHARLMSKFAFCLRPNIGFPFDQHVHRGLVVTLAVISGIMIILIMYPSSMRSLKSVMHNCRVLD